MPSSTPDEQPGPEDRQSPEAFLARMRDGIRSGIARLRGALPPAGYPTLTALICSSACAPVVAAALGAGATMTAAIGTLGAIGGNALSGLISDRLDRIRSTNADADFGEYTAALTEAFEEVLQSDSPELAEIRNGVATLLQRTDAFEIVIRDAVSEGNRELLAALLPELDSIASSSAENQRLLARNHDLLLRMSNDLAQSLGSHGTVQGLTEEILGILVQMSQLVQHLITGRADRGEAAHVYWEESPYLGLQPFTAHETPIFFGRTVAIGELVAKAKRCVPAGLMIVAGPSGVGKSSLLRAGLVPAIESGLLRDDVQQGPWRCILIDQPGNDPVRALAQELAKHGGPDSGTTRRSLEDHPEEAADRIEERRTGADGERPERVMLVVDQFEELYTLADAERRDRFLQILEAIRESSRAFVVLGVRSDHVDRCMAEPTLRPAAQHRLYRVGPMTRGEMRLAATAPAAAAGMCIDDRVIEELLEELCSPTTAPKASSAALPLLSQTMLLLWERGRDDKRLSYDEYVSIGGVRSAVKTAAERVYGSLNAEMQAVAEHLFRRLTGAADGGRLVRLTLSKTTLTADENVAAQAFLKERLLVADETTIAIAHDVLLDEWDRLRDWLEPDLTSRILFTQFEADANEWDRNSRDTSFLYQGARLATLETGGLPIWEGQENSDLEPSEVAVAFLHHSRSRHLRGRRLRRILTGTLVVLTSLALILAGMSYMQSRELSEQRNHAISLRLAAESIALLGTDGQLAQVLAATAWELSETDEAYVALVQSMNDISVGHHTSAPAGSISAITASSDGDQLATHADSGQIGIWSTADWSYRVLAEDGAFLPEDSSNLVFSPDGELLAAAAESTIKVWNTATFDLVAEFESNDTLELSFASEGDRLAFAREGEVGVWDLETGTKAFEREQAELASAIHFDPDGGDLLIATANGELIRWDAASGETVTVDAFGTVVVESLWLSGTGAGYACGEDESEYIAQCLTLGADGSWTTLDSSRVDSSPWSIAPDGSVIAALGDPGLLRLIDPESGTRIEQTLQQTQRSSIATVIPKSQLIAFGTDTGFQLLNPQRIQPSIETPVDIEWFFLRPAAAAERIVGHMSDEARVLEIHGGPSPTVEPVGPALGGMHTTALSADGTMVAGLVDELIESDAPSRLKIIDIDTGEALAVPAIDGFAVEELEFSPIGDQLAILVDALSDLSTGGDEIWLWDISDGEITATITAPDGDAESLAFSPDGNQLATSDGTGVVSVWDAGTGDLLNSMDVEISYPDIVYSTSGDKIGMASEAGLRIWDLATHSLAEVDTGPIPLGFVFSPDDRYVIFGTAEGVQVWDLERDRHLMTLPMLLLPDVFFLADSWRLLAEGGGVKLLDLSFLVDPHVAACERLGRSLTEPEWEEYLPEFEFEEFRICD